MKEIHLTPGVQTNRRQPLVAIHLDYQNIPDARIAEDVLSFASSLGYVVTRNVYNNWQASSKAKKVLEGLDFDCVHVSLPIKNAVDFKLVTECTSECSSYLSPEIVILITGDDYGNFLLDELQPKSKKVIIFARRGSEDKNLPKRADKFYYVDQLPDLILSNIQSQKAASVEPKITYKDATEYLREAIKTASIQGKRTSFPLIDSLMRQQFSNYRGASSICKNDGKPFSRFGKFINAAVVDGKVRMQNQDLFLIE